MAVADNKKEAASEILDDLTYKIKSEVTVAEREALLGIIKKEITEELSDSTMLINQYEKLKSLDGLERIPIFWKIDKSYIIIAVLTIIIAAIALYMNIGAFWVEFKKLIVFFTTEMDISIAYADDGNPSEDSPIKFGPIFNIIFTIGVIIAFFWAYGVSLHSKNTKRIQTAKEYAKLFGGIFIGSAKSTLGI